MFLISDTQIVNESFLEDIESLLNTGEIPNLFPPDEKHEIVELGKVPESFIDSLIERLINRTTLIESGEINKMFLVMSGEVVFFHVELILGHNSGSSPRAQHVGPFPRR